jgi:hypothetical protein
MHEVQKSEIPLPPIPKRFPLLILLTVQRMHRPPLESTSRLLAVYLISRNPSAAHTSPPLKGKRRAVVSGNRYGPSDRVRYEVCALKLTEVAPEDLGDDLSIGERHRLERLGVLS